MNASLGATLISGERDRQLVIHQFSAERDDAYVRDELARAAIYYAHPEEAPFNDADEWYPSNWSQKYAQKATDDRVTQLVKAGALIAAEIDRLLRLRSIDAPLCTNCRRRPRRLYHELCDVCARSHAEEVMHDSDAVTDWNCRECKTVFLSEDSFIQHISITGHEQAY